MAAIRNFSKAEILEVIENHRGFMTFTDVAKALNCTWITAKSNVEKHKETFDAFREKEESELDALELRAFERASQDDSMLKYMLSTKGKHRGYSLPTATINQTTNVLSAPQFDDDQSNHGISILRAVKDAITGNLMLISDTLRDNNHEKGVSLLNSLIINIRGVTTMIGYDVFNGISENQIREYLSENGIFDEENNNDNILKLM